MDKTAVILGYLNQWQEQQANKVETDGDVFVFNTIGQIINLVSSGLLSIIKLYNFIDLLSLENEEKETIKDILSNAYDYYKEERHLRRMV